MGDKIYFTSWDGDQGSYGSTGIIPVQLYPNISGNCHKFTFVGVVRFRCELTRMLSLLLMMC